MKKLFEIIKKSGLLFYLLFVFINYFVDDIFLKNTDIPINIRNVFIYILPFIFMYESIRKNIISDKYKDFENITHFKAAYPSIPRQYLSKKPRDMLLGRYKGKYMYVPITKDGINSMVVAAPGVGKSNLLKAQLLSNEYKETIHKRKAEKINTWNYFLIDVDGLIYKDIYKCKGNYRAEDNDILQIVELNNRQSYGFDVFYRINKKNVTDTEKIKMVSDIAEALVPETKNNPYFSINAKKIITGVLLYGIEKDMDFISIIHMLLRNNLDELLTIIVDEAEVMGSNLILDKLKAFVGKDDNESIQDIESTLKQYLDVFSYPDVIYCLQTNINKTSPQILNDGKSNLILSIETSMLSAYQPIFRLITMMVLKHCESEFSENDNRYTSILIDEAARIGKVNGLADLMATGRKYHVNITMLYQDMAQFRSIYGKDEATAIFNLCELKVFLSLSGDNETLDLLKNIAGKYNVTTKSYKRDNLLNVKSNMNYREEERDIITGNSVINIRQRNEAIIIYFGKYYRIKKVHYYTDKVLAPIYKQIKQQNAEKMEIKK